MFTYSAPASTKILACSRIFSGVAMWAIIRKPTGIMPSSRAAFRCWMAISASVTWVATRTTWAPLARASFRSSMVPTPGRRSTPSLAFFTTRLAALSSSISGTLEKP